MKRDLALAISFALGLAGGVVLFGAERSSVRAAVADPGPSISQTVTTGDWRISESGVLTWEPSGSTVGTLPDFTWYAERAQALAGVQVELECQINSCDDASAAPATVTVAAAEDEYAERSRALDRIAADIECQINSCEP